MKYFEALAILVILCLVFAAFVPSRGRQKDAVRPRYGAYLICVGAALLISSVYVLLSPSEERTVWGDDVSQQFVVLGESDGFHYQRALVLTPARLPLPSLAGVLSAVAPEGAKLDTRWVEGKLHITASRHNGTEQVPLACANRNVLGVQLVTEFEVPPCPAR